MTVTQLSEPELHVYRIKSFNKRDVYVMECSLLQATKLYLNHINAKIGDMDNIYDVNRISPIDYIWHKVNGKFLDQLISERGQFAGVL